MENEVQMEMTGEGGRPSLRCGTARWKLIKMTLKYEQTEGKKVINKELKSHSDHQRNVVSLIMIMLFLGHSS